MANNSLRRDLYLQVNASTDPFTRAMKAAAGTLSQFGTDVDGQLAEIQERFDRLGGANADASARALESSFRRSFSAIQQQAKDALTLPTTAAGAVSLDVTSARAAADAATRQAIALREIADAAARAAIATNGENDAQRVYAAAATAAAVASEENALALRNQATTLAQVQTELDIAGQSAAGAANIVTAAHGRMSASGLIMQHVVRSTVDSFSAGLPITMIFGEQIARVGEAAALSEGSFGKFGAFLTGPLGLAFTAALAVGGPFVAKLFEADDAAKKLVESLDKAVTSADSFGTAQSELGKVIDLTTGKLKTHNAVLVETIRLQAEAVKLAAQAAEQNDTKALAKEGNPSFWQRFTLDALPGGGSQYGDLSGGERVQQLQQTQGTKVYGPLRALIGRYTAQVGALPIDASNDQYKALVDGALSAIDQLATKGQLAGKDPIAIKQAFLAIAKDRVDQKAQQDVLDVLNGKPIPADLKPYQKPKTDHSVEKAANEDRTYTNAQRQEDASYTKAIGELTDNAQQRYDIAIDQLQSDLEARNRAIDDQVTAKKLTAAHGELLKNQNIENAAIQGEVEQRKLQSQLADEELARTRLSLDGQLAMLALDEQFATTRKDRLAIELQRLKLERDASLAEQRAIIAKALPGSEAANNAQTAIGQINDQYGRQVALTNRQNASPFDAYKQQLEGVTGDMNDALEGVAVDGLSELTDGIGGAITKIRSFGDAWREAGAIAEDVIDKVVADLAKMAIEKAIVSAIGGSIFGLKDGGEIPGFADGGLNGLLSGPGTGRSDSMLIRASNGEFIMNAESTRKYLPLLHAMNDNHLPAFADGGAIGSVPDIRFPRLNAKALQNPANNRSHVRVDTNVNVTASPLLHAEIQDISLRTAVASADPIATMAQGRTMKELSRPRLPGGYA